MDLSKYLSQAITTEMDACVPKTTGPHKKRYCNKFFMDEMVDWAAMEVQQQGGSSQHLQKTDKGKEKVSQDKTEGVKARTSTIDKGKEKSIDYLSLGEEELIELRNKKKANREAKAKGKSNSNTEMTEPNAENNIPAEFGMPTFRTLLFNEASNAEEIRFNLDLLQEIRESAAIWEAKYNKKVEHYYNKRVRPVAFRVGDFVYWKNEASIVENKGKLGPTWEGPYKVLEAYQNESYKLGTMDDKEVPRTWNAIYLQNCFL
ncbi:hypothetical protein Tco_1009669 [Tanacetum coccineum]